MITSINPGNGLPISEFPTTSPEEVTFRVATFERYRDNGATARSRLAESSLTLWRILLRNEAGRSWR